MNGSSFPKGTSWGLVAGIVFGASIGMNSVNWNLAAAALTLPTLVAHLALGATLGLLFGTMLGHRTTQPVRVKSDRRRPRA